MHTLKEVGGEIDACVSIPEVSSAALDHIRNALGIELFKPLQNSVSSPKANDDFWHPEEERLYPEFQELSLELGLVTFVIDFGRSLQFHPIDRQVLVLRLDVPNYSINH